jgi:uncharacterized membrane protein YwzB
MCFLLNLSFLLPLIIVIILAYSQFILDYLKKMTSVPNDNRLVD